MTKVVVVGLGRFGTACATRLYDQGAEVLAIDRNHNLVNEVQDTVTAAIACDATQRANLAAYDVGAMDVAVVAMGANFEASVLVTLLCRELGAARVLAKAVNPMQKQVLYEVGADEVVMPEEEMGARLADHILRDSVLDFVDLPTGYGLRRIPAPEAWVGQNLADLELLQRERVLVVQVVRPPAGADEARDVHDPDTVRIPLPGGDTRLEPGDFLDVIAADEVLDPLSGS